MATFLAECPKCGTKFGHPGPCPNCQPWYGPHIQAALDLAYEAHNNEFRKGGAFRMPYIGHIYDIMGLAKRIGIPGGATDLYQTVILHDTVESGFPIERIRAVNSLVADYVEMLSFDVSVQSKEEYMASFADPEKPIVVVVAKLLDRMCNVWDFYNEDNIYFVKYFHKAEDLFRTMFSRRDEIMRRWGEKVWDNLQHEYRRIEEVVMVAPGTRS